MGFAGELPVIALWVPSLVFLGIYMSFIGITYLVGWSFASAGGQGSSANKLQRFFVSTVDEIVQHLVSEGGDGEANGAVVADIRETLESHYTSVRAIFWIGFPTAICAVISPLILQSRKMSSQLIFLTDDLPGINEAVACFLVPAGMVYAIFFGFTYQHGEFAQTHT